MTVTSDTTVHRRRREALAAVMVLALSSLFFLGFHDYDLAPFDEGVLMEGIRLQNEERMDFSKFTHYSVQYRWLSYLPSDPYPDIESVRLVWVGVRAVTAVLILLVALRIMPLGWAFVPVICFLGLPGPWHKSIVSFSTLLCIHAMLWTLRSASRPAYCWLSFCLALAFALHPYTGLPTLVGWLVLVAALPVARTGTVREGPIARRFLRWHGPALLALTLFIVLLADYVRETPPLTLAADNLELVAAILPSSSLRSGLLFSHLFRDLSDPRSLLTLLIAALILPVMATALCLLRRRAHEGLDDSRRHSVLCVVVVGSLNLSKWLVRGDLSHLVQNSVPVWILVAFVVWRLLRPLAAQPKGASAGASTSSLSVAGAAAACLSLLAVTGYVVVMGAQFVGGGIGLRLSGASAPLAHPHGTLHVTPSAAENLNRLVEVVRQNTEEEEYILVFGREPILYYLSGRRNPLILPLFSLPTVLTANPEEELIEEIRRKNTRLIVFDRKRAVRLKEYRLSEFAPKLYRMVMDDYEQLTTVGTSQVRVKREPHGSGSLDTRGVPRTRAPKAAAGAVESRAGSPR